MRRAEIEVLDEIRRQEATLTELADKLGKNPGYISTLTKQLQERNLLTKDQKHIQYAKTHEAKLIQQLMEKYSLETLLSGKKEQILQALKKDDKTVSQLEKQGFSSSTVYSALNDVQTLGAVKKLETGEYSIADDLLKKYLEASQTGGEKYSAGDQELKVGEDPEGGLSTAFSAFQRYGIDYYPAKKYWVRNIDQLNIEDVVIHAVKTAGNRKQASMTALFYLEHRKILDKSNLWEKANKWGCVEEWADTLAYADQREPRQDRFLTWKEFTNLAEEYGVFLRGYHPEKSLAQGLENLGRSLENSVEAYLLGGGNLIFRGLKDSTKDLDLVVGDRENFQRIKKGLQKQGYEKKKDLGTSYKELNPVTVYEKEGSPRYDVFVETVAGKLKLTEEMKKRSDQKLEFGKLKIHLLSLTDIFLFKSITEREGDFEDATLIARTSNIDWKQLYTETKKQDKITGTHFSFAVLETINALKKRENIQPPIQRQLSSYCLENALLVMLEEPKTIEQIREKLDFPTHQIYNKLSKLEKDQKIKVDRTGKLNQYRTS